MLRTSIYKFKGLERLVVGVVELESVRDEVFYVGFSRPNVFLSIFAPESARRSSSESSSGSVVPSLALSRKPDWTRPRAYVKLAHGVAVLVGRASLGMLEMLGASPVVSK